MPQFDTTFFQSQVFWTIVSFAVLFGLLNKWVLPKITQILDKRRELVARELQDAAQIRAEAEAVRAVYQQQMDAVAEETTALFKATEKQLEKKREHELQVLEHELSEKRRIFLQDEKFMREQAIKEVQKRSAELVVKATEQLIQQKFGVSEAQKFVEEAIADIEQGELKRD